MNNINLFDDQMELYVKTTESFKQGNRRVLCCAPCGAGKSYLFVYMCQQSIRRNKNVLILVHRRELAEQHIELLKSFDMPMEHIRVALFQSEKNRLGQYEKPGLIICDEAHWIPNTLRKVLDFYNTFVVGLTATPCRLTGEPMGAVYQELITGVTVKQLIDMKRLAPFQYYSMTVADVSQLPVQRGDYSLTDAEKLLATKAIFGNVISTYKKLAEGKKTIVYCTSIKHSQSVAEEFRKAGYKAMHIDSNTPKKERQKIMSDFRSGKVQILCNVQLIVEGISVPDCECCILLRPTLSTTIYIQSAMRCMRYKEGKTAVIIDMVANYGRLGLPDDDREWSLDKPIKAKRTEFDEDGKLLLRTCTECFRCFKTADKCPWCGAEYETTTREMKHIEDIELKRIEEEERAQLEIQKKSARMEVGMARSYGDLQKISKERGYAPGWAYIMAKKKGLLR